MSDAEYNGWTNYETWNVALWIGNDEGLYRMVRGCRDWPGARQMLADVGFWRTPDGVSILDPALDSQELDDMVSEL